MIEVTDPNIVSQLESKSGMPSSGKPVTDQSIISQLESKNLPSAQNNSVHQLFQTIANQTNGTPPVRTMQPQEQFSNPTQMPGFENLPKDEQLKRIAFSQLDPANQNMTGGYVPPGTYEAPGTRMAASIAPTLAVPELSIGEGLAARYLANPLLNTASRIGTGTASNIAYNSPDIKTMQDLKDVAGQSLGLNSLLEGVTLPFRAANYFAEMSNPLKYATNKANTISNEYSAAKALQKETYAPVMNQYGNTNVVPSGMSPENYLGYTPEQLKYFTPDMKKSYQTFLDNSNFQNLHNFQSQAGTDYGRYATNPNKIKTAQTIRDVRDTAKSNALNFLQPDDNALQQYNMGSDITRDLVKPYEANKTLKQVSKGVVTKIAPEQLENAIKTGSQKILYEDKGTPVTAIPSDHPLMNHMNDLKNMINFGGIASTVIPATTGAIAGEIIHPGIGGLLGGASSGLGAAQLAYKLGSGAPGISKLVQNPLIQNAFKTISPIYYGAGRSAIGASEEK